MRDEFMGDARKIDREALTEAALENLRKYWRRADADTIAVGREWYVEGRKLALRIGKAAKAKGLISGEYGVRSTGAAALAVLSPRKAWATNVAQGLAFGRGETFKGMKDQSVKLWKLKNGFDPDDVVGGPKVRSFWCNLSGCNDCVTVDIWALRAAFDDPSFGDAEYRKLSDGGRYDVIAEAYRRLAAEVGESPAAVQAIVWIVARGSAA